MSWTVYDLLYEVAGELSEVKDTRMLVRSLWLVGMRRPDAVTVVSQGSREGRMNDKSRLLLEGIEAVGMLHEVCSC